MAIQRWFANIKLAAKDSNGDYLRITKRVNYLIDDANFATAALQIGAVNTAVNDKIAMYCANTNAGAGVARTIMGLVGVEIGQDRDAASFSNIDDWAVGTIPVGQNAKTVRRQHVQFYSVKDKGLFKFTAPEPTDALENLDYITVEASAVFPIGDALAVGVNIANSYYDEISEFNYSKFKAK